MNVPEDVAHAVPGGTYQWAHDLGFRCYLQSNKEALTFDGVPMVHGAGHGNQGFSHLPIRFALNDNCISFGLVGYTFTVQV